MNAIAGGGTLLTFPALLALGVPPIAANATSTVALVPGSVASLWGYRAQLAGARQWAARWALPSLAGGATGALLLLWTPAERFEALVPWLIWGATALFMANAPLSRWIGTHRGTTPDDAHPLDERGLPPVAFLLWQFAVATYGGYFGAGAGILMLAAMGLMGLTNIHQMNGLKNWGGTCINVVAVLVFVVGDVVRWELAAVMAAAAAAGGLTGSRLAQRVGAAWVRRAIVAIGFGAGAWELYKRLAP